MDAHEKGGRTKGSRGTSVCNLVSRCKARRSGHEFPLPQQLESARIQLVSNAIDLSAAVNPGESALRRHDVISALLRGCELPQEQLVGARRSPPSDAGHTVAHIA
jgi:hypothetical protein